MRHHLRLFTTSSISRLSKPRGLHHHQHHPSPTHPHKRVTTSPHHQPRHAHHSEVSQMFRDAMSRVAQQAMILTSSTSPHTAQNINHGMTLGSVASLAVYPRPLLQFNLHLPSYTSRYLHEFQVCCIHMMPATKNAARLARVFASGVKLHHRDGEVFHERTQPFRDLVEGQEYFMYDVRGVVEKEGDGGGEGDGDGEGLKVPVLSAAEVAFVCRCSRCFTVDDHEIWVVEVLDVLSMREEYREHKTGGLIYFDRAFRKIGEKLS
ncbi:uncharacterized protein LODBEIA_P45020 [Lodderomyces beijingensis]|uniref:Flavin reductase like domain-containing protein n=1 Tax=Lodderomyces beijingensis TaxID=1775926 RepID=A0ABP0ZRG8_9ASCO